MLCFLLVCFNSALTICIYHWVSKAQSRICIPAKAYLSPLGVTIMTLTCQLHSRLSYQGVGLLAVCGVWLAARTVLFGPQKMQVDCRVSPFPCIATAPSVPLFP